MRAWESWGPRVSETVLWSLGLEGWAEFEVIDMRGRGYVIHIYTHTFI